MMAAASAKFFQPKMASKCSQFSRNISIFRVLRSSMAEPLDVKSAGSVDGKGGTPSYYIWKKIFYYVCVPAMLLASVNVVLTEEEPPPEFKKYSHLRIRNKKFPWGDGNKTFFHNPHRNALPDGYEVDITQHHKK